MSFLTEDNARELDRYLQQWMQRRFGYVQSPFFMATVASVTQRSNAPPLVTVSLPSDATPSPHQGLCAASYNNPAVGDTVVCVYNGPNRFMALFATNVPTPLSIGCHYTWPSGSLTTPSGSFTRVPYNVPVYDRTPPDFNTSTSTYVVPFTGRYVFIARTSQNAATGTICSLFKNGSEFKRGSDSTNSGADSGGEAVAIDRFVAGDQIDGRLFNRDSIAHNMLPGAIEEYFMAQCLSLG